MSLIDTLAVTAELLGTDLSKPAVRMMLADLSRYTEDQVMRALHRCRLEHQGRLTLAAIVSRIDTGHPGPEEAWAIAKAAVESDNATVVWTSQISNAASVATPLADAKMIAARMAFVEAYRAQDMTAPPDWHISLGYDTAGRDAPIMRAVEQGRLPAHRVITMLPHLTDQIRAMAPALDVIA